MTGSRRQLIIDGGGSKLKTKTILGPRFCTKYVKFIKNSTVVPEIQGEAGIKPRRACRFKKQRKFNWRDHLRLLRRGERKKSLVTTNMPGVWPAYQVDDQNGTGLTALGSERHYRIRTRTQQTEHTKTRPFNYCFRKTSQRAAAHPVSPA